MFSRNINDHRQKLAHGGAGGKMCFAQDRSFSHAALVAVDEVALIRLRDDRYPFPSILPGPARVGRFFARHGQRAVGSALAGSAPLSPSANVARRPSDGLFSFSMVRPDTADDFESGPCSRRS